MGKQDIVASQPELIPDASEANTNVKDVHTAVTVPGEEAPE